MNKIYISDKEKRASVWKERISPDKWAERYYVLEKESAIGGGRYSFEYAPHAKLPLKILGNDTVNKVTLLFASQAAKTTIGMIYLNYHMDRVGGNFMFFLPDERLIPFTATDRIVPSIKRTINAKGLLIEKEERKTRDNTKNIRYPKGVVRVLSSTNATNRKSTPAKAILLDEIAEMQIQHVREIEERAKTFELYGGKILCTSTLMHKNDPIDLSYKSSEAKYEYFVKCPTCNKLHVDNFLENIVYDKNIIIDCKDESEKALLFASKASRTAKYKCPHCGDLWNTKKKNEAVKKGGWQVVGEQIQNPRSVGFKCSSFISLFVSLEKMTKEYLSSITDEQKEIFFRGWLSKIYVPKIETIPLEKIKKLKSDLDEYKIPDDTIGIVSAIDVQKGYFYYICVAVDNDMNTHIIDYGRLESWADLESFVCFSKYNDEYPEIIGIDSGYNTSEIYDFCLRMNYLYYTESGSDVYNQREGQIINIIPLKGNSISTSGSMKEKYTITKIEKDPATGRAYTDSLALHVLNTFHYKESASLHIDKGIMGQEKNRLYLHKNSMDDICESFASERKVEITNTRGKIRYMYEPVKSKPFNHYWDCYVYALHLIDALDFVRRTMFSQQLQEPLQPKPKKKIDYMDEF